MGFAHCSFGYSDPSIDQRTVSPGDRRLSTYEGVAPGFEPACLLIESAEPWLDHLADRGYGRLILDEVYGTALGEPPSSPAEDSETAVLYRPFLDFLQKKPEEPWFAHLSYISRTRPGSRRPLPRHARPGRLPKPRRAPTIEEEASRHPYLEALLAQPFTGWLGRGVARPADLTTPSSPRYAASIWGS
jgi:hypothetical protein